MADELSARAKELRQELAALNTMLSGYASKAELAAMLAEEREKTKALVKQRNWTRTVAVVLLALVMAGTAAGVLVVKQKTDEIVGARKESRLATCLSDNTFITNHNGLVDQDEQTLRDAVGPEPSTAAAQFLATRLAAYETNRVPLRKCDPASIDAFYKRK